MFLALITVLTACSTYFGGSVALRFKDKLHLIIGFSAGAVLGVAFFDLLPEAFQTTLGTPLAKLVPLVIVFGFLSYTILDRFFLLCAHNSIDMHPHEEGHEHTSRGVLRAGSLSIHSFLDGLAIGLSFQVSQALGLIVGFAVLAHDFSDGINTVTAIIKGDHNSNAKARRWLLVDALAPVLGVIVTRFFVLPEAVLGVILALFSGFFIYISASDLIPESYHAHPTRWTTIATILGAALIFIVIHLAG